MLCFLRITNKKIKCMKRLLITLFILLTSVHYSLKVSASLTSTCILSNPPYESTRWVFAGNQIIWVAFTNSGPLGATLTVVCHTLFDKTDNFILLPFKETKEYKYDKFGECPIGWGFTLSTISSAACIGGHARWDPF